MTLDRTRKSFGSLDRLDESSTIAALASVRSGKTYSLDSQWWRHMHGHTLFPTFDVITYRTPSGLRNQGDVPIFNPPENQINYGTIAEQISGTVHTGTHIDALCHVTCGTPDTWHGGHEVGKELGDFGPLNSDASGFPPVIARGVLLDVPRALGLEHCAPGYAITAADLEKTAADQGVKVRPDDVVLVRTGQMRFWPDSDALNEVIGSGVTLSGGQWLLDRGVVAVGSDSDRFECSPSEVEGSPQPVHVLLIHENGIPILEWVYLEELAADEVYEFAFMCLPLRVVGATGSYVRPVAIV